MTNRSVTLESIYDDTPDRRERLWDVLREVRSDFWKTKYLVVSVDPRVIYRQFLVGDDTTLADAYKNSAEKRDREIVAAYRKQIKAGHTMDPIVVYGAEPPHGQLVDGWHRVVAMALERVKSCEAVDLDQED